MATAGCRFVAEGNFVRLQREIASRRPFAKPTTEDLPFPHWMKERPAAAAAAVARILQALGDGECGREGEPLVEERPSGALLHDDLIAQFSDSEAQALGFPPTTRLSLELRSSGLLHKEGFRIEPRWIRAGGVPVPARIVDSRIHYQCRVWRIPEPLWSTLAAVDEVNQANDLAQRQTALGELKRIIGSEAADRIRPDGIIDRLRLHVASGFSLAIHPSSTGFDFDPVLFSRERIAAKGEDGALDEEADSLLPLGLAAGFTRRFRGGDGTRRTYLLDDGSLLFLDPDLSQALGVVRTAQGGSAEQRRAFLASPQRHIADALGMEPTEEGDGLFVATQQFSERVAGVDIWRKPVLPWIKPKPNSWLPESFGLRVGDPPNDRMVPIAPEDIQYVAAQAEEALKLREESFEYRGETLPATATTRDALACLVELSIAAQENEVAGLPPEAIRQKHFLQVQDNLESLLMPPFLAVKPRWTRPRRSCPRPCAPKPSRTRRRASPGLPRAGIQAVAGHCWPMTWAWARPGRRSPF